MASPLAVGAGAGEGLDSLLNRILVEKEVNERQRHNMALESLQGRSLDQQDEVQKSLAELRNEQAKGLQQNAVDRAIGTSNRQNIINDPTVPAATKIGLRVYESLPQGEKTFPWELIQPKPDAAKNLQTHFVDLDMTDQGVPKHLKNVPVQIHPDTGAVSFNNTPVKPENVHSIQSQSGGLQFIQGPEGWFVGNKNTGSAAPVTGPGGTQLGPKETAQTQAMREGASMLRPNIPEVMDDATQLDQRNLFGPVMSRVRDLATKLGTTQLLDSPDIDVQAKALKDFGTALASDPNFQQDELTGRFASALKLLASGAGRVHGGARGGGSIQMIEYMKDLLSSTSTLGMFRGRLQALDRVLKHYEAGPVSQATPGATPQADAGAGGGDIYDQFLAWKKQPK